MPYADEPTTPRAPRPRKPRPGPLAQALTGIRGDVPPGAPNAYDFSGDPLYQRILALGEQRTAQANAQALRERTQAAIDYGDADLARSLGLGEADIAAAAQNPFSVFAKLAQNEKTQPLALDENLSKKNLFWGGHRGLQQSELSRSLLEARANAGQRERDLLGGIETNRLGALGGVADQTSSAAEAAAARRQQQLGDLPVQAPFSAPRAAAVPGGILGALRGIRPGAPMRRPRAPRPAPAHGGYVE